MVVVGQVSEDTIGGLDSSFQEQLKEFLELSPEQQSEILNPTLQLWRSEVIDQFHKDPNQLKQKLDDCEEAFRQLATTLQMVRSSKSEQELVDWISIGKAELQNKQFQKALASFQKAMVSKKQPSLELLTLAGTAALHCKEYSEAEVYAEQAISMEPNNIKAIMLKGLIHYSRKEFEIALQVFERALNLKPESAAIKKYYRLAKNYVQADPLSQSMQGFTSLTSIVDPTERREFPRAKVSLEVTVNDFENMTSAVTRAISLSASGCLLEASEIPIPEEFNFSIDLGDMKVVHGYARVARRLDDNSVAIQFETISPESQELINSRIVGGVYGPFEG